MIKKIIKLVYLVLGLSIGFLNGMVIGSLIQTNLVKPITFEDVYLVVVLTILSFTLTLVGISR